MKGELEEGEVVRASWQWEPKTLSYKRFAKASEDTKGEVETASWAQD